MSEDDKTKVIYELGLIQDKLNELSNKYDLKFELEEFETCCLGKKIYKRYVINGIIPEKRICGVE